MRGTKNSLAQMITKRMREQVARLPDAPGVYFFRDKDGKTLYIGKAKSLKKRVQSYFGRLLDAKTEVMLEKASGISYRRTPSEAEAELLEAALIKEHRPAYNIGLKDDKSFPWVKISAGEFPVVSLCRRKKGEAETAARYYGPYTNADLLRQALKVIRRVFGFRSCKRLPKEPCLYYRLRLCPAPCAGKISSGAYGEIIEEIGLFLESRYEELIAQLSRRMQQASRLQEFEQAARIRDQINALSAIGNTSGKAADFNELEDMRQLLGLERLPRRIEAFDISNIQGASACGSMVSFYNGEPDKNNYRRFRIKTVKGIDDFRMTAEVVSRRYTRLAEEHLPFPDLILIDGGRQHLLVALKELHRMHLDIPVVSIAKERENIYIEGRQEPLQLKADTPALNLIRRVRDEAHRFALSYHRLLRKKKALR